MNDVPPRLFRTTCIPQIYMSTKRVQSRIIVTEDELGHWNTMFEGDYDSGSM